MVAEAVQGEVDALVDGCDGFALDKDGAVALGEDQVQLVGDIVELPVEAVARLHVVEQACLAGLEEAVDLQDHARCHEHVLDRLVGDGSTHGVFGAVDVQILQIAPVRQGIEHLEDDAPFCTVGGAETDVFEPEVIAAASPDDYGYFVPGSGAEGQVALLDGVAVVDLPELGVGLLEIGIIEFLIVGVHEGEHVLHLDEGCDVDVVQIIAADTVGECPVVAVEFEVRQDLGDGRNRLAVDHSRIREEFCAVVVAGAGSGDDRLESLDQLGAFDAPDAV